jgi:hypothetical protein
MEKVGTGTGYRVMEKNSQVSGFIIIFSTKSLITPGLVIMFLTMEKVGTGTGYRVMERKSQVNAGLVIIFSAKLLTIQCD